MEGGCLIGFELGWVGGVGWISFFLMFGCLRLWGLADKEFWIQIGSKWDLALFDSSRERG
jgi:hypothetical protein